MRRTDPLDDPYLEYEDGDSRSELEAGYIKHGKLNQPTRKQHLDFGYPPEGDDHLQIINNRSRDGS